MRWEEKRFKDCKHFKQGMAHAAAVQNEEERTCSSGSSLACAGGAAVLLLLPIESLRLLRSICEARDDFSMSASRSNSQVRCETSAAVAAGGGGGGGGGWEAASVRQAATEAMDCESLDRSSCC